MTRKGEECFVIKQGVVKGKLVIKMLSHRQVLDRYNSLRSELQMGDHARELRWNTSGTHRCDG